MNQQYPRSAMMILIVLFGQVAVAQRPRPALVQVDEDPNLPRVLLIGDSISMGYTLPVRELLKGKANVQHPTENCLSSRNIVAKIDQFLGQRPWDVIVFNCGIHDLTFRDADRKFLKPNEGGNIDVPLNEYEQNLEKIVSRLQKTGAKLIWCMTSPVGDHVGHRQPSDVVKYNDAAKKIMDRHSIPIADPYQKRAGRENANLVADGVHFTRAGYQELAERLAPIIEATLAKSNHN